LILEAIEQYIVPLSSVGRFGTGQPPVDPV
jgi:hypothetical protein